MYFLFALARFFIVIVAVFSKTWGADAVKYQVSFSRVRDPLACASRDKNCLTFSHFCRFKVANSD
jgi:hypothetical protein